MSDIYDGLENVVAGIGTSKDKRSSTEFTDVDVTKDILEIMYGNDWLASKIVDCPADDMTRKWRYFDSPELSPEQMELIENEESNLRVKDSINEALKWARLYGGSIVYMNVDGQGLESDPLDPLKVRQGQLLNLIVLDKTELKIDEITTDILSRNYRKPEYYKLGDNLKIHYSRVLRFDGCIAPMNIRKTSQYWGYSVVKKAYEAILNSQTIANSVSSIVYEASIDVVKIPDLFAKLLRKGGESELIQRFQLADLMKSFNNCLILDSKEEYTKVATSFAGLPDLIIKYLNIAAGASDIPATRLLGQSAQGLNATGEGDLKNYYDMIQSKQETDLRSQLRLLDSIMVPSAIGSMPLQWSFGFHPLWQTSEVENADIELKNAQRDQIYLTNKVLPGSIVAKQLQKDSVYLDIDSEYLAALESVEGLGEPDTGNNAE